MPDFTTPILLITYKKIDTTLAVLKKIKEVKPEILYISSNYGKNAAENIIISDLRGLIDREIDWECKVRLLYRDTHLSAKKSIHTAIDWLFENEEMGIILEDDCLPDVSFFDFCQSLLREYRSDQRIWHISGTCTIKRSDLINNDSFYFSNYCHIWGWATWADRWTSYDPELNELDVFIKNKFIQNIFSSFLLRNFWTENFVKVRADKVDTWDYQWYFSMWVNNGLSIIPTKNLISNIGFGVDGTHTTNPAHPLANLQKYQIEKELIPPKFFLPNRHYDDLNGKNLFNLTHFGFIKKKLLFVMKRIASVRL